MAQGEIYLGLSGAESLLSAGGRTFTEKTVEIAREARTASGRLVKEIVTSKKEFRLRYSIIDHADLAAIEAFYALESELSLIVHYTYASAVTYTVLLDPIDKTRILAVSPYCWGNVTVDLREV